MDYPFGQLTFLKLYNITRSWIVYFVQQNPYKRQSGSENQKGEKVNEREENQGCLVEKIFCHTAFFGDGSFLSAM